MRIGRFVIPIISLVLVLAFSVSAQEKRFNVPVGDSPTLGAADAPVTIIEFLDYQ